MGKKRRRDKRRYKAQLQDANAKRSRATVFRYPTTPSSHSSIYDIHEPIPTEALGTCNIDSASSSPSVASNLTINTSASRVLSQQQPQSGPTLASGQNNCPGPVGHGSNVSVNNFEIPPAPTKAEVVLLRPHQATAWATAKSYAIVVLNMGSSIKVLHDWYDILTLPPMMSSDAISLAV
ncbi:hypothetical protein QAD02_007732 [Eretmocerus hayati]|uniref:Uncharacterized protein n=1 Tax=Eretmocerus hayati TaxID=131215 RepID=A0ACC2N4H9_9HYME|nr:hypothetical protein QAD02_007732 [Eretmocerus hayati]